MAPFKLKFRMGSSRSTSQETEPADSNANQALLNNSTTNNDIGASSSTIDSFDCTSLSSTGDKRLLLPNNLSNDKLGYSNPATAQNTGNSKKIDENTMDNLDMSSRLSISTDNSSIPLSESVCNQSNSDYDGYCGGGSSSDFNSSVNLNNISPNKSIEHISISNKTPTCIESICGVNTNNSHQNCIMKTNNDAGGNADNDDEDDDDMRKESIDSRECLLTPVPSSQENLNENHCTGSCDEGSCDEGQVGGGTSYDESAGLNDINFLCSNVDNQDDDRNDDYSDRSWHSNTTQIINNKSSKKIYKAVAKQFGITCTMSDQCRCMECQSNYFDCEFDENDQQHSKMDHTDGGLGAGTPMLYNIEVMHGSACNIL